MYTIGNGTKQRFGYVGNVTGMCNRGILYPDYRIAPVTAIFSDF